ncbi:MAG TPA: YlxR family protein [Erysipelothrix sp.]|jgi:predicted RNA-binding protein YlxR (DUF448 family)|nr:YlxR family protein [Erysipelothrix sp.]
MTRKIPMRRCVVSNEMFPKKELLRITKNKEGQVSVDPTGKAHGRGAYILKSPDVLDKAIKTKALERALGTTIEEEVYEQIRQFLK